jgi:hypothetical protein
MPEPNLLLEIWADVEARGPIEMTGSGAKWWRVTLWRLHHEPGPYGIPVLEVDVDWPHADPEPGLYWKPVAFELARRWLVNLRAHGYHPAVTWSTRFSRFPMREEWIERMVGKPTFDRVAAQMPLPEHVRKAVHA